MGRGCLVETVDTLLTIAGIWTFIASAVAFGIWLSK
nr:MAG TPA: hypothetical protein [Caudoviricetes sp.]